MTYKNSSRPITPLPTCRWGGLLFILFFLMALFQAKQSLLQPCLLREQSCTSKPAFSAPAGPAVQLYLPLIVKPYTFEALSPSYEANCQLTQIKGRIRNLEDQLINGVTVRVSDIELTPSAVYTDISGNDADGFWNVKLANEPKAGQWYVQVVDDADGTTYSDRLLLETNVESCAEEGKGHQIITQNFRKVGNGPGTVVFTATPTPTSTNTPTATPTQSVPTATPTFSQTGTVTRTPTPAVYANNPQPDAEIPDGPNGFLQSQIQVSESIIIREMQIYLNIGHDNIGELDIDILHPDGTRIRLHSQGENDGEVTIQRWFNIYGKDLAQIVGKSTQGTWNLEIIDRFEDNTGELGSWQIEIYP